MQKKSTMINIKYNSSTLTLICGAVLLTLFVACNADAPSQKPVTKAVASPETSVSALTNKIKATPNNANLYVQRASAYYKESAFDEAIADLTKALSIDSTQVMYYHSLADVYLDYNKSRLALETMTKASNRFPKRIPTLLKLSEFQLILTKNQESLQTLNKILQIDPQNSEAFFMLGLNFKDLGDEQRAINSFQSAVENNPDLIDAWVELGYLYDKKNDPIASKYFDNALRVDSTNVFALEAKGNHLGNQGKFAEAIQTYKKIHRLDRENPNAYYNIGLAYLQMDSIAQAARNFDISVNVDPLYIMGYFYRAYTAELRGDKAAAQKDYEQVLRLNPDFERAQAALEKLK